MRKSGQNTPLFKDRSADQHTLMGFRGIGQKRAAGEAGPAVALLGVAVPLCVCFPVVVFVLFCFNLNLFIF